MRQNEHLPSPEILSNTRIKKAPPMPRLAVADAEHVEMQRYEMLGVVEGYLSVPFQKSLREKISQEKEDLMAFVAHEKQIQDAAQKIVRVLNPAYFTHRPLDKTMFE